MYPFWSHSTSTQIVAAAAAVVVVVPIPVGFCDVEFWARLNCVAWKKRASERATQWDKWCRKIYQVNTFNHSSKYILINLRNQQKRCCRSCKTLIFEYIWPTRSKSSSVAQCLFAHLNSLRHSALLCSKSIYRLNINMQQSSWPHLHEFRSSFLENEVTVTKWCRQTESRQKKCFPKAWTDKKNSFTKIQIAPDDN